MGIIVPKFKKGDTGNLNNYKGITLLSIVGKIFTEILNSRLKSVIETFFLLNENQAGFRSGYRTTDHIFTLHSLIDNYVYKNKRNLYVCFIDFRKAFDKVNLRHLWKKMIDLGLTGKFLGIMCSMYDKVSSCVIAADGLTDMFKLAQGVQQGCLLSPLLFASYLNDLEGYLTDNGAIGVKLRYLYIRSLLYADDLILLAETRTDLQLQMNLLSDYANI